jgi:YggT family protein
MVNLLIILLQIYSFIVLARVLLSWFPNVDPYNPIVRFLYEATEPVLEPIRRFIRQQFPNTGPFDFSPLVLLIGITIISRLIISTF